MRKTSIAALGSFALLAVSNAARSTIGSNPDAFGKLAGAE
jgi:hypothetical protein